MSDGAGLSRRTVLLAGACAAVAACSRRSGDPSPASRPSVPIRLRTRWEAKPDGPLPQAGDEGIPFRVALSGATAAPAIRDGALDGGLPARPSAAAYVMQDLGERVTRIGARFGFGPGSASGSVALIAFTTKSPPTAHCHMVFAPDRWIAGVVTEDGVEEVSTHRYRSPVVQDGREVEADVRFSGTTTWVTAPDGTTTSLDDARFGAPGGVVACWEFYKDDADAADAYLYETWAG